MKQLLIFILPILLISCINTEKNKGLTKANGIRTFVEKVGFIELPYTHNLNIDNENFKYLIDSKSIDSLFFESPISQIIGVIPDTTENFAVLYYEPGDDLYPCVKTFNKRGEKVDNKKICFGYCAGCGCECDSCSDLTTISKNLEINMTCFIKATECDSVGKKLPETTTCKILSIEGNLKPNGEIVLNEQKERVCE